MADETNHDVDAITARLGEEGQITVPEAFRDSLNLEPGSPIAVVRVGHGLVVLTEPERFEDLRERLGELVAERSQSDASLLGGVVEIIANQERMLANHETILDNEAKILTK